MCYDTEQKTSVIRFGSGTVEESKKEAVDLPNTNEEYGVETGSTRHRKIEAPDKRDWKHEDEKVDENIWYVSPYEPSAIMETMSTS